MSPALFGRAWKVKVTPQATGEEVTLSDSRWGTETLKAEFTVETAANEVWWFADIAIYNSRIALAQVLQKGDIVTLEAGYENPGVGLIFKGQLRQPIWERHGDTDFRLILHCFINLIDEDKQPSIQIVIPANTSQAEAVRLVCRKAGLPEPEYLDPVLERKSLSRAEAFHGPAEFFFLQVAIDNGLDMWTSWNGLNIRNLAPKEGSPPEIVYLPPYQSSATEGALIKGTLIGTPVQTELGVTFVTLLDHQARVGQLIKLEKALLKQILVGPGQRPPLLAKDGTFVVVGLKHIGDTRGNPWYTQFCCITPEWAKAFNAKLS